MQNMQAGVSEAAPPRFLTTRDVQRLIRVDRSTIYRMAEDGRLPAVKVGRQWRFPEDRLRDWLQSRAGGPTPSRDGSLAGTLGTGTLQAVSDLLGEVLGAMVVVTDLQGRPLAPASNPCGLFTAAHQHAPVVERCIAGWQSLAAEVEFAPQWRTTPFGFLCARSLVRAGDRLVGAIVAGGIAPPAWPPPPAECDRLAAELGMPAEEFRGHVAEVHHLDQPARDRVLRLLPQGASFLSRLAGQHNHLAGRLEAIAALASSDSQRREL